MQLSYCAAGRPVAAKLAAKASGGKYRSTSAAGACCSPAPRRPPLAGCGVSRAYTPTFNPWMSLVSFRLSFKGRTLERGDDLGFRAGSCSYATLSFWEGLMEGEALPGDSVGTDGAVRAR